MGYSGTVEVEEGSTIAVAVTLATNFKFDGWFCADTLYSAVKDFTLTMGVENIALEARYTYSPTSPVEPSVPVTTKNELYLMSVAGLPGEVINYPLYLNNVDTLRGISMLMLFPKGMQADFTKSLVAADAAGADFTSKLLDETDEEIKDESLAEYLTTYDIYQLNIANAKIAPTNTPLLTIPVTISDTISSERFRVWLSQVEFTLNDSSVVGGSTRNGVINTAYEDMETYAYLDNLIKVGSNTVEVSQKQQLNTAVPLSFKTNMNDIITALGCSDASFVTFKGASAPGMVTDQITAGNGYWFARDGYACSATDTDSVLSIGYDTIDSTLVFTQKPNALAPEEVLTTKVYFTYKYKYYETDVTFTVLPNELPTYKASYMVEDTVYHAAIVILGQKIPEIPSPTKPGYTFAGWDGMPADSIMPAQDVTLTAKWTVNRYALNYMLDGELLRVDSIEIGAAIVPATTTPRLGCTFGGWEGMPAVMPAYDVTVYGFNHIVDTDSVALDGHLTEMHMAEINALSKVRTLDLTKVTNATLAIGGMATLEKAILPATLTSYDGVLSDCPDLLEVTLGNTVEIPSGAFPGSGTNTNMIVYAPADTPTAYAGNVVAGGVAGEITLEDGKALSVSTAFTAKHISYTRTFRKTTYPGECSGWETITLPFDVDRIENEGTVLAPFRSGVAGARNFWLAGLTSSGFGRASRIQANVPYIICMPNSEEYMGECNINGAVTFSATDAVVHPTVEGRMFSCPEYDLVPTYRTVESDTEVYAINDEQYNGYHPGSLFVNGMRNVRPFEAYLRRTAMTANSLSFVIGSNATGIMLTGEEAGEEAAPAYFDLLGRQTTAPGKGIRIVRDKQGRYVKTFGKEKL